MILFFGFLCYIIFVGEHISERLFKNSFDMVAGTKVQQIRFKKGAMRCHKNEVSAKMSRL